MKKSTTNLVNHSAVRARASCWLRTDGDDEESYVVRTTNEALTKRSAVVESQSGWYRIRIPSGYKYDSSYFLLELRREIRPKILTPYCWRAEKRRAQFYIDDFEVAVELAAIDCTIDQPDGCKMEIIVENFEPFYHLNDSLKAKMAEAMNSRYNAATKSMDLSKFFAHEHLRDDYCPLHRPAIMQAAIEILAKCVPELETLSLNNNRIQSLRHVEDLEKRLPNLKALYLADNWLPVINSLQFINQTNIVEIVLAGNPLCEQYIEDAIYLSEIRRRFPKLRKLDGIELPPLIGFDIDADFTVPPPKIWFSVDPIVIDDAKKFLEAFYDLYDSNNWQRLVHAYHDQALFSLTAKFDTSRLSEYLPFVRNLYEIPSLNARMKQLITGKHQIISLLSKLPATRHNLHSFTMDLTVNQENLTLVTVTGIFCDERRTTNDQQEFPMNVLFMRSFHRTFAIKKNDDGSVCITNDMLHVNILTRAQEKVAFNADDSAPTTVSRIHESVPDVEME